MNWVFPIAGYGTRTKKLGNYKPLIEIFPSRSILNICLSGLKTIISPEDRLIFIASEAQESKYSVGENINKILYDLDLKNQFNVVLLDKTPPGQALTIKNGVEKLEEKVLKNKTFVVNSDQFVFFDFESIDLEKPAAGLYFNDTSSSCFYNLDIEKHVVNEIKEKEKISCYASSGVFYFPSAQDLINCIKWGIKEDKRYNNELYLGPCMGFFDNLSYFQTLIKFDLGNNKKIDLFKKVIKGMEI